MGEQTSISWADSTVSIWMGCQETGSPACTGCYARALVEGRFGLTTWGPHGKRVETKNWRATLRKISRLSLAAGRPWFVFVNSLSDFFDNQADPALRAAAFEEFRKYPHLTFLLLTKRPQNIVKMFAEVMRITADEHGSYDECWPRNVAIGCTVVTQAEADRDVPKLLGAAHVLRPAFTFLSIEPMVEQMNIMPYLSPVICSDPPGLYIPAEVHQQARRESGYPLIDWVIAGGESGQGKHQARPCNPDAFVDIQIQCEDTATPFMFKQWGDWIPATPKRISDMNDPRWRRVGIHWMNKVGTKAAGRTLLGKTYDARPEARS